MAVRVVGAISAIDRQCCRLLSSMSAVRATSLFLVIFVLSVHCASAATGNDRSLAERNDYHRHKPRRLIRAGDSIENEENGGGSVDRRTTWQAEMNQITCCNGGTPIVPNNIVRNFTIIPSDYTIEERTVDDVTMTCRDYEVRYLARRLRVLNDADADLDAEVPLRCRCITTVDGADGIPPSPLALDANCRRLGNCKNGGQRSSSAPFACVCPQPHFGAVCQFACIQGSRLRGHNGRDYCSCAPFFQGEECRDLLCLNGGREEGARCTCPPQFLGPHCEINTNHTGAAGSRFQRFGDQGSEMFTRDVSGTIFSLIMIIVLVVSMYLLMKHRMQTRYLNRRPDLFGACNFPASASHHATSTSGQHGANNGGCIGLAMRSDLISPDDPRLHAFRIISAGSATGVPDVGGPPPYFPTRGRRGRGEVLPPLPTYEDATKLPPLRHNISPDDDELNDDENEEAIELATRGGTRAEPSLAPSGTVDRANSGTQPGETIVATVRGNEMVRQCAPLAITTTSGVGVSGAMSSDAETSNAVDQHETASLDSSRSTISAATSNESTAQKSTDR